jgi:signal transduction histidine kinase
LLLLTIQTAQAYEVYPLSRQDSAAITSYNQKYTEWLGRNDLKEASRYLNLIAMLYWEHNHFPEAVQFYELSLKHNLTIGNENGMAMIHNNLAMIYSDLGEYQKSLEFFDKTLAARRSQKERIGIISALINKSVVLNNLKKFDDSVKSLDEALSISRETYDIPQMKSCYAMLAETYEKMGNAKMSLQYFELYKQMHEKLQGDKIKKSQEEVANSKLRAQLAEAEKQNQEIELKLKDKQLAKTKEEISEFTSEQKSLVANLSRSELEVKILRQSAELDREHELKTRLENERKLTENRNRLVFLIIILVLGAISLVIILQNNQQKRKALELLEIANVEALRQKNQIQLQNKTLNVQKDHLEEAIVQLQETQHKLVESEKMAALGNLVAGVAHEINTPVGIGVTLASDLMGKTEQLVSVYKANTMKRTDLQNYLETSYESSRLILNNLQRTARLIQDFRQLSIEEQHDSKQNFELIGLVKEVITSLKPKYQARPIEVRLVAESEISIYSFSGAYAQIITNLMVNALKYAFVDQEAGFIELSIIAKDGFIHLTVADNGKGMPESVRERVFEPFFTTDKMQGTGLGLHIIYNLVRQHLQGSIDCISKPGEGTRFVVKIPRS